MFFAAKWDDVIFAVAVNPAVVAVSGIVAPRLAGRCSGYHENAAQAVRADKQYKSLSEGRNRFRKALFCYGMPCRCLPRRHGTFATPARHVCHAGVARLPCRRGTSAAPAWQTTKPVIVTGMRLVRMVTRLKIWTLRISSFCQLFSLPQNPLLARLQRRTIAREPCHLSHKTNGNRRVRRSVSV